LKSNSVKTLKSNSVKTLKSNSVKTLKSNSVKTLKSNSVKTLKSNSVKKSLRTTHFTTLVFHTFRWFNRKLLCLVSCFTPHIVNTSFQSF